MKVFVAVVLAIGSVAALGSGPYLPSGWRPKGPAFFLPGEEQKPADNPIDVILFETEASGSDSLREYGPPKDVSENVISQGLPDAVTDQTFLVVEEKAAISAISAAVKNAASEETVEQKSEVIQEQTTEAQLVEEVTAVYERIADIELQTDVTTALYAEEAKSEVEAKLEETEVKAEEVEAKTEEVEVKSEEVEAKSEEVQEVQAKSEEIVATIATVENLEQVVAQEVQAAEVGVQNIAEALANLETEIKTEQVQTEAVAEIKVNLESSESAKVPEGFLEYGPPGFREYGPPKGDELLRSAAVIQEPSNSVSDTNDARRRRFSPKFKAPKSKRSH